MKTPSLKQIDIFLKRTFGKNGLDEEKTTKVNMSGARFARRGIADYYIANIGWVGIKRNNETLTNAQLNFLLGVNGFLLRFEKNEMCVSGPFDIDSDLEHDGFDEYCNLDEGVIKNGSNWLTRELTFRVTETFRMSIKIPR